MRTSLERTFSMASGTCRKLETRSPVEHACQRSKQKRGLPSREDETHTSSPDASQSHSPKSLPAGTPTEYLGRSPLLPSAPFEPREATPAPTQPGSPRCRQIGASAARDRAPAGRCFRTLLSGWEEATSTPPVDDGDDGVRLRLMIARRLSTKWARPARVDRTRTGGGTTMTAGETASRQRTSRPR